MLYDDDFRPSVAPTLAWLQLHGGNGSTVQSSCGSTQSADSYHSCTLVLREQDFTTTDLSASLVLSAGSVSHRSVVTLKAIPPWFANYCDGLVYASCDVGGNYMFARGPSGPVRYGSLFTVDVLLHHTANAGVVNFRFQFDPAVVSYVSSSTGQGPYGSVQVSNQLIFGGTNFTTGHDALVSATTLTTTYPPSAEPTLVCTLTFTALASGDALRMSVTQVLGVGNSELIDNGGTFVSFDVLGQRIALAPRPSVIGILGAMASTVANLHSVSGRASSYSPYVVSVASDYSGVDVVSPVSRPVCSSPSLGLLGCVNTTAGLESGNASIVVVHGGFNTTIRMKAYAPEEVSIELSTTLLRRLCGTRYQSATIRVLADGKDVTAFAAISGSGLAYDAATRTLRPSASGVYNVSVAGVPRAQLTVLDEMLEGVSMRGFAVTSGAFSTVSALSASARVLQLLTQEGQSAEVYAVLMYSNGTTEPLGATDVLLSLIHI